jgi:hypothetical protein
MPDQAVQRNPGRRLITDKELAALRPAPRRSPVLVALRAEALGLEPHRKPAKPYSLWPLLIIVGVVVAYLVVWAAVQ